MWLIIMVCLFGVHSPQFKYPESALFECGGDLRSLQSLLSIKASLYGCENTVDLVLLRGLGKIVDWRIADEVAHVYSLNICSSHLNYLLTDWTSNATYKKKFTEKNPCCSLPLVRHELKNNKIPSARNRMNKEDSILFMNHFLILCHPGTYVCSNHQNALRSKEFNKFTIDNWNKQSDNHYDEEANSHFADYRSDSSFDEIDDIINDPNFDEGLISDGQSEITSDSVADESMNPTQITTLRAFSKACGLTRIASDDEMTIINNDTIKKKAAEIVKLFDYVYKVAGGKRWKELKAQVEAKIVPDIEDDRVSKMMNNLDDILVDTENKSCRLKLISLAIGVFTEREIIRHTGVSRYAIRQAKLHANDEIINVVHLRTRFNQKKVDFFSNFMTYPEVSVSLPNEAKLITLSSGKIHSLAEQARLRSYNEIYRMFERHCEERGREAGLTSDVDIKSFIMEYKLGYSTCIKIMKVIAPKQNLRLQCVDMFRAEAMEAFDTAMSNVTILLEMGRVVEDRADLLHRELKADWNFITASLRSHLSLTSTCAQHCLQHSLSDSKNASFFQPCNEGKNSHVHDKFCGDCAKSRHIYLELTSLVKDNYASSVSNDSPDRFRLKRMVEESEMGSEAMLEYCNHIVRCAANELVRKQILNQFCDNDAMATMDFSLKLQPQTNVEAQSQWYGKRGISFHCTHILTLRNNHYYQHTFGAIVQECSQDSSAVTVFVDHFIRILKHNGIKRVFFKSDNAACYHNSSLMASIVIICNEVGVEFGGFYFSESQDGKGSADRQISHAKRKSRDYVNGGGDSSTASEIVHGLIKPTLLRAYSFYEVDITSSKNGTGKIKGIKSYGTFKLEGDGIRVWRHTGIGPGIVFKTSSLIPNQYTYIVRQEGGHLSESAGFWGDLGSADESTSGEDELVDIEPKEDEISYINPSLLSETPLLFHCPENLCSAVYKTRLGLEKHIIVGKHRIPKEVESVTDRALKIFSMKIEKSRVVFERVPINLVELENSAKKIEAGFALVSKTRRIGVIEEVASKIEEYFHQRRGSGKRADAKEISLIIRNLKNPDTSFTYSLRDCPRQGQSQTIINRLLKKESEGDAQKSSKSTTKGRKKSHSKKRKISDVDTDEEEVSGPTTRSTRKARNTGNGRRNVKIVEDGKTLTSTNAFAKEDLAQDSDDDENEQEILKEAQQDQYDEINASIHDEYEDIFL